MDPYVYVIAVITILMVFAAQFSIASIIVAIIVLILIFYMNREDFRNDFGIEVPWKAIPWTPAGNRNEYPDVYPDSNMHVYQYDHEGNPVEKSNPSMISRVSGSTRDDPLMQRYNNLAAEHFEQIAPEDTTAFDDGKFITDDNGGFNRVYWSNFTRSNGIRPGNQVDLVYDEGVAFNTGTQQTPTPSDDWNWMPVEGKEKMNSSDLFDISEEYSTQMEDPRALVEPHSGPYKKIQYGEDLMTYMTRSRNDRMLNQAHTGTLSSKARELFTGAFQYELSDQERLPWWSQYE